jgi:L-iditol 2-dehydrogenase
MLNLTLKKNKSFVLSKTENKDVLPNQYKIKICYTGICASDIPRAFKKGAYFYPLVLGHEFSGKIVERGKKAKKFNINDSVSAFPLIPTCNNCASCKKKQYHLCEQYSYYGSRENGSLSEFLNVNEWNIFKVDRNFPLKLASLFEPISVTYNIFNRIHKNDKKEEILVLGGGFLGLVISGILNFHNFRNVTILDRNKYRLNKVPNKNYEKIQTDIDNFKSKNSYKYIIDFIGNTNSLNKSLSLLDKKGKLILAANVYKKVTFTKKNLNFILRKELILEGIWNSTFKVKESNWKQSNNFIKKNSNWIKSLITHEVSLEDAPKLFRNIYLNKRNKIKKFNYIKGLVGIRSNEKN